MRTVTRCPSDRDCWWVEGLGHFSGMSREAVERMVANLERREQQQAAVKHCEDCGQELPQLEPIWPSLTTSRSQR